MRRFLFINPAPETNHKLNFAAMEEQPTLCGKSRLSRPVGADSGHGFQGFSAW
jgi:hypothetical protein